MMKMTIDEYAKEFNLAVESINAQLKEKQLNFTIEDGIIYIDVTQKQKEEQPTSSKQLTKPKTTVATVIGLYQKENRQLKEKIIQLEAKIDKLIDDKEQMLRAERDKIEQLYSTKDEQIKNILELINTKMLLQTQPQTIHEVESLPKEIDIETNSDKQETKLVELKSYLKSLDLKSSHRKQIKKRFLAVYDSDVRIIQQNGKLYLDFSKYDYSDLLNI